MVPFRWNGIVGFKRRPGLGLKGPPGEKPRAKQDEAEWFKFLMKRDGMVE